MRSHPFHDSCREREKAVHLFHFRRCRPAVSLGLCLPSVQMAWLPVVDTDQLFLSTKGASGREGRKTVPRVPAFGLSHPPSQSRFLHTTHKGAVCRLPVARDGDTQEIAGCVQWEDLPIKSSAPAPRRNPPAPEPCWSLEVQSGGRAQPLPKALLNSGLLA